MEKRALVASVAAAVGLGLVLVAQGAPMELTIHIPDEDGLNLSGAQPIIVTAVPTRNLRYIRITIDGNVAVESPTSPATYTWDTRAVTDGTHLIGAIAQYKTRKSTAQLAVTVNNSATPPPPATFPAFGIAAWDQLQDWPIQDVRRQFDDYANLNARWVRHDFEWNRIEPQKGQFQWAGYDAWVTEARLRNIGVIALVSYTPAWANGGHADHAWEPSDPTEFGRFAGDVARRYASQGVHLYEIWNEPNIGFWKPVRDPAKYTAVLREAYIAIHAVDPQAVVITGGTSPAGDGPTTLSPQTWLQQLYANGAKLYFDAVGHHPYVDAWSNWEAMADYSTNLRQIMTNNGDAAKRIHATEVGCNGNNVSDCTVRLDTAFDKWRSYSWAGVLAWFTYWDPNVYGLVDGNWAPRPLWHAYKASAA